MTAGLLELMGYTVMRARDAVEAVARFNHEGNRLDILITALVLANGRSGLELAAALRGERPDLPVLLITGYGEATLHDVQSDRVALITRPFDHVALARAVREAKRLAAEGPAMRLRRRRWIHRHKRKAASRT